VCQYARYNFFVCGPKFIKFYLLNVEGIVVHQAFFLMFDMSIRSGDIHAQNRKLSKIAPKFGRSFGPVKFLGAGLSKVVRPLSPLPRGSSSGEFS